MPAARSHPRHRPTFGRFRRRGVMSAPLLHLLAALWMAVLSPALCCCGIRSSLGHAATALVGTPAVVQQRTVAPGIEDAAATGCPACANRHHGPVDTPVDRPGETCHCHEVVRAADAPTVKPMVHVPTLLPACLLLAQACTEPAPVCTPRPASRAESPPRPPGTPLLALHCMLTT